MRCVVGSAVMAWRNCTTEEQHWTERQTRLQSAVDRATHATRIVVQELGREPSTQLLVQGKAVVISTVTFLADLAGLVRDESTASKVALYSALGPWIEPTLILLSYYIHDSGNVHISQVVTKTKEILAFFVVFYRGYRSHISILRRNIRQLVEPSRDAAS